MFLLLLTNLFADNENILTMDEIKPGMKGYGLTVFKGIKIEKFEVEIIATLKNIRPRTGLILARLKSDVTDKAGVIAGMSGSPIYINNKLIGALAFSWAFSKEPIAGITPIEDMLKILSFKTTNHSYNFEPGYHKASFKNNDHSVKLIKTPLIFQDASQELISTFRKDLQEMNFVPLSGGGNTSSYEVPKEFKPGAAVGVNLVTGDLNISGIGTVTYVNKDKLLIFGHPMFFSGSSDIPLSHAYIHTVLPSMYVSFKMGSATEIAGRIYQDQLSGLAGTLTEKAKMIPVNINLNYFKQKDNFNYNIIRSYFFLPRFLTMVIYKSVEMTGGWLEKTTLDFTFDIQFNNNKSIKLKNTFASLSTSENIKNSMLYLLSPISHLMVNKFKDVQINNIKIQINIDNKIKIAEIESVKAIRKIYKPGETLKLRVKFKPYKKKIFYKNISIKLPHNLPQRKITLFITSDQERQFIDYMFSPFKYQPQSFKQLINLYNKLAKSTDLSVWTFLKDKSIIAKGDIMENLPASYYSLLQNSLETGMERSLMQIKNKIPVDYIVTGSAAITIEIKKKLHYKK